MTSWIFLLSVLLNLFLLGALLVKLDARIQSDHIEWGAKVKKIHVIIARYNEDVSHLHWLTRIPHTIYNRGEPISDDFNVVDCLENLGRESFLYLKHIANHYYSLPEFLIFSQAQQSVFAYNNTAFQNSVEDIYTGRAQLAPENDGFAFLIPVCGSSRAKHDVKALRAIYGRFADSLLADGYKTILNFPVDNPRYSGTGCFVVNRETIWRNTKQFYVGLGRNMTNSNPMMGHFLERAWPAVFRSNCTSGKDFHCLLGSNITC